MAVKSELAHTGVPFDDAVDAEVVSVVLEELDEALAEADADELSELAELDELAALLDVVVPLPAPPLPSPPLEHPPAKASAATMPVVAMPRMMPWMTACAEN